MSGTDCNAQTVQQHPHIIMMDIAYQKRKYRPFMRRLSENAHTVDRIQLIGRVTKQLVFISRNIAHSQTTNIAQGFRQSRTAYIIRRSSLELERQFVESRLFKRHGSNHLPSSLVRRQLVQPFFLAIQDTDNGMNVNLINGKHIKQEIKIQNIQKIKMMTTKNTFIPLISYTLQMAHFALISFLTIW